MTKLCECGCGEPAPIAKKPGRTVKAGEAQRFVMNHDKRKPRAAGVPACGYVVDPDSGCWVWMLNRTPAGYGKATPGYAHRMVYEERVGPIPAGFELDHRCRNRACINPDHLEVVTATENVRRSSATKLTAEQVAAIKASSEPSAVLAERFGVTQTNVSAIRRGVSWRDIEPAATAAA